MKFFLNLAPLITRLFKRHEHRFVMMKLNHRIDMAHSHTIVALLKCDCGVVEAFPEWNVTPEAREVLIKYLAELGLRLK